MTERLCEVRTFVSKEMDIESACRTGSPIHVTFANGEKARIHLVKVEVVKSKGLYQFTGSVANISVEGFYGNDQRPKRLLSGFGMVKLQ